jgi:Protein of unknown function (DUF3810)
MRRKITFVCLVVVAVGINVFAWYPAAVENYYSRGFYPVVARCQRLLFGWIPFSMGDILYGAVVVLLLYRLVRGVRRLVRRQAGRGWLLRGVGQVVFVLLWVYVLFNVLWGLNYNRLGIADQLQLQVKPYTTAELNELTEVILGQLNGLDSAARSHRMDRGRMTPSLFSYPGLYIGFAGYYNPFTGEAQVNMKDPLFGLPYTGCHEMGHQLGYAKENEANFIGFLAARSSPDPAFSYSTYLDLFLYSIRELYVRDSALAKGFKGRLAPGVRADLKELQRFNRKYENPLEPVIWNLYGKYLRANRQPHGIVTYTEVTAWLIAYANKNGWDKLKWRVGGS